jgi:Uncharacterized small protein (DUF2292).
MNKNFNGKSVAPAMINEIIRALERVRYGEVVIIVHDSEIVQIETRVKKRFAR